jgi:hypothetical protein
LKKLFLALTVTPMVSHYLKKYGPDAILDERTLGMAIRIPAIVWS